MSNHMDLSFNVIYLEGGKGLVGTDRTEIRADGEGPARKVTLKPFGIADTTVTNNDFARFVEDSGYLTDAEQLKWSFVYLGLRDKLMGKTHPDHSKWSAVEGAKWSAPLGPGSDLNGLGDHPVVHASLRDAQAFASWAGGRLPTEAEWEHAAQGQKPKARYPWGDEEPDNAHTSYCNIWRTQLPTENTAAENFYGTTAARSFSPNEFGLYNLSGNVWEWCDQIFRVKSLTKAAKQRSAEAKRYGERVLKGGSYLCDSSTCWRYRIAARTGRQPDNSTSNCGFRLAFDSDPTRR